MSEQWWVTIPLDGLRVSGADPAIRALDRASDADRAALAAILEPADYWRTDAQNDAAAEVDAALEGVYGELVDDCCLVWEQHGRVHAFILVARRCVWRPELPDGPFLLDIAVSPEYRRKGLARRLVEAVVKRLGELSPAQEPVLAMFIDQDNAASIALFSGFGAEFE